ncbi:unnamed protein product [Moneuplotes crassus]|uniref:Uncharacterized protein n=1 Tax=Euplotes crassus TaxID=5936 RepID=A0AAD1UF67_EUPCR|nr:unnamed protein product [Moneuplotes crassus]
MTTNQAKNILPLLADFRCSALDNFSFKKAIDMKNKMYDTMNLEGILKHPLKPKVVIHDFDDKKRLTKKSKERQLRDIEKARLSLEPVHTTSLENPVRLQLKKKMRMSSVATSLRETRGSLLKKYTKTAIQSQRPGKRKTNENLNEVEDYDDYEDSEDQYVDYQPKKTIPMNLYSIRNIRVDPIIANVKTKPKIKYINLKQKVQAAEKHSSRPGSRSKTGGRAYHGYINRKISQIKKIPELNITKSSMDSGQLTSPHRSSKPHYIYIIPDGINILKDKYQVFKIDIQPYVNSLLPKPRKRKYHYRRKKREPRKELHPLSEGIKRQVFKQFLADLTIEMKSRKEITALYTIDGVLLHDLMQIQPETKVFISSTKRKFIGVKGIGTLESEEFKLDENREKTKHAFLKACENWIDANPVYGLPEEAGDKFLL